MSSLMKHVLLVQAIFSQTIFIDLAAISGCSHANEQTIEQCQKRYSYK